MTKMLIAGWGSFSAVLQEFCSITGISNVQNAFHRGHIMHVHHERTKGCCSNLEEQICCWYWQNADIQDRPEVITGGYGRGTAPHAC